MVVPDLSCLQILQNETFPNNLKSVAFGILRRLSGKFRRLPQSYQIEEGLSTEGNIPFSIRGVTTLWKGRWSDTHVAIKMLRLGPDDDKEKIAAVSRKTGDRSSSADAHSHLVCRDFAKKFCCGRACITRTYSPSAVSRCPPSHFPSSHRGWKTGTSSTTPGSTQKLIG